ncbi:CheR family methyltransferase [Celeribacter sp.]|uniref:CheR family methyltransferase n=1 Tax=Celeribacter sp. TaxID=1890673 RepID=UPI003A8E7F32
MMIESAPAPKKAMIDNEISAQAYARIVELSRKHTGIVLTASKAPMVKSRLTRRLRALGMSSFDSYMNFLEEENDPVEMSKFISALTTNVTNFFRESHHFDHIANGVYDHICAKLARGQRVRIWSAGCSNGQEPYSIAMTLLGRDMTLAEKDIRILATDIDPQVLAFAQTGAYTDTQTVGISRDLLRVFFDRETTGDREIFTIKPQVRNMVTFRQLNLHNDWPMAGTFDLIMCRNVMIYFDDQTQARLLRKFAAKLADGGWLMIGHSERLPDDTLSIFTNVGVTTYQRKAQA